MQTTPPRHSRMFALLGVLFISRWADAADSVNLGVATWIGHGPIYSAAINGQYKKCGLDVKLINFSDNSLKAGARQRGAIYAATPRYDQVIAANA